MRPNLFRIFRFAPLAVCFVFVTAVGFLCPRNRFELHSKFSAVAVDRHYVPAPKNPLRLVIARFPRYEVLYGDPEQEKLTGWRDTLDCGHQIELWNFGVTAPSLGPEQGAKRHRCAECAEIAAIKKPAQSVSSMSQFARSAKAS